MAQPRRRSLFPGQAILGGEYRIRASNTEELECDGDRHCHSLVLDFLQDRFLVPCPHTFGTDGNTYCSTLWRFLSDSFSTLGLGFAQDVDPLVEDLVLFVLDFAMNGHSCPLDGPQLIPVPRVSVVLMADISVTEVAARSFEEATVWAKRATDESIEALETVGITDSERDGLCVICFDGFDLDDGGTVSRMPCGHVFHRDCIAGWLKNSHMCPLCRFEMPAVLMQISS